MVASKRRFIVRHRLGFVDLHGCGFLLPRAWRPPVLVAHGTILGAAEARAPQTSEVDGREGTLPDRAFVGDGPVGMPRKHDGVREIRQRRRDGAVVCHPAAGQPAPSILVEHRSPGMRMLHVEKRPRTRKFLPVRLEKCLEPRAELFEVPVVPMRGDETESSDRLHVYRRVFLAKCRLPVPRIVVDELVRLEIRWIGMDALRKGAIVPCVMVVVARDEHLFDRAAVLALVFRENLPPRGADHLQLFDKSAVGQIPGDQDGIHPLCPVPFECMFENRSIVLQGRFRGLYVYVRNGRESQPRHAGRKHAVRCGERAARRERHRARKESASCKLCLYIQKFLLLPGGSLRRKRHIESLCARGRGESAASPTSITGR